MRGLEYCTLQVMVNEIAGQLERTGKGIDNASRTQTERTRELFLPFVARAKQLLIRERFALQTDHLTYERCDDPEIRSLRDELFSRSKSHGGKFKELLDVLDALLFSLMVLD